MMSFCKNTLHTFLGFSPAPAPTPSPHHHDTTRSSSTSTYRNSLPSSLPVTAGLITITDNSLPKPPPNILESSTLKPSSISTTTTTTTTTTKQDSISCNGSGSSLDEISGGHSGSIDGLSSCTESLGFESSEQMEQTIHQSSSSSSRSSSKKLRKNANTTSSSSSTIDFRKTKDGVHQMFPPLLSSLLRNDGQNSTCFLKSVRQNGRLLLTQVTISRPDIFRASRQDGRLILQFIKQEKSEESNQTHEEVIVEKEVVKESCSGGGGCVEWKIPAAATSSGGGEGLKRCHEVNLHHQNHHMQHWNQPQCVTSR